MPWKRNNRHKNINISTVALSIWANYNNSLTWIKAIWGWFPLLTMIPVRSQWGRYNLPRSIHHIQPLKRPPSIGHNLETTEPGDLVTSTNFLSSIQTAKLRSGHLVATSASCRTPTSSSSAWHGIRSRSSRTRNHINQLPNQSTDQPTTNQPTNQTINQPFDCSSTQPSSPSYSWSWTRHWLAFQAS